MKALKLYKLHHAGDIIDLVWAQTQKAAEAWFRLNHGQYRDSQNNYWLVSQVATVAKE